MPETFITSIGTANPVNLIDQKVAAEFMASVLPFNDNGKTWIRKLYQATGIKTRYSVLNDYSSKQEDYSFFPKSPDLEPFPSVENRMQVYQKEALPLALTAADDCFNRHGNISKDEVTHLITVSCTGMYAPGLDIEIMQEMGMRDSVERTAVNFMGCYAAFNALKLADHICKSNAEAKVLIVCVELCTLHFQKDTDKNNLVANSLFGDGASATLVESGINGRSSLVVNGFYSALVPEGKSDMAWKIGNFGFEMRLSTYVPELLKGGLEKIIAKALKNADITLADISHFATHPGGKKILEVVEEELGIDRCHNSSAHKVLEQYGNMSSPTVMFVLKELMEGLNGKNRGEKVLGMAFGPGLTTEIGIFEIA